MIPVVSRKRTTSGGVLTVTLVAALVAGTILTAYIVLISNHQKTVNRSEAWNAALPVAEAGVEEALAHLNRNFPSNLLTASWAFEGTRLTKEIGLGDTRYRVEVSPGTNAVILAKGLIRLPWNDAVVSRTLRVTAVLTSVVYNAIATKEDIKLNGYSIRTDSYDSSDPNYSGGNGQYVRGKAKDGGDIATNLGITGGFDTGNSQIFGKVGMGPNGTLDLGPLASIGSTAWHTGGNMGVESGWFHDDVNVPMPDAYPPSTSGQSLTGGVVDGMAYNAILGTDYYVTPNFGGRVMVTGHAQIVVTDRVQFTGLDFIKIMPGASLTMYVTAPVANIGGLGVINLTGLPTSFTYMGSPNNSSLSISGNGQLAGFIYAPSADITLNGGGNVYGAIMGESLAMNGGFSFHYDEALARYYTIHYFKIVSWDEM